ncbi:MAG TPA: MBL fold metallo-hydrolase [Steroidobacteraceae bacterium]|jgi:glyoxylase-like metal-dependent hydrolase (beta-lactamase superfamily II)
MRPDVKPFRHESTGTWSYVVVDPATCKSAIVDPVLDFDVKSGQSAVTSAAVISDFVRAESLTNEWILETHAHADHLSAAPWLQAAVGGRIAIGQGIREVQRAFRDLLNLEPGFPTDGRQFNRLLADGEEFAIGSLHARVIATPGHTGDSLSYLIGDAVFVGDSIFMPDSGTARCDFPGGDANRLYASIRRLYELPGETRVFVCHDYKPGGREARCETTIAAQREANIHLKDGTSEEDFAAMRRKRDATLDMPALLYPAVQFNIRGGRPPPAEANGRSYLKLPLKGPDS